MCDDDEALPASMGGGARPGEIRKDPRAGKTVKVLHDLHVSGAPTIMRTLAPRVMSELGGLDIW